METKKKQGSPTYQEERFRVVAFLGVTTKGTREGGGELPLAHSPHNALMTLMVPEVATPLEVPPEAPPHPGLPLAPSPCNTLLASRASEVAALPAPLPPHHA